MTEDDGTVVQKLLEGIIPRTTEVSKVKNVDIDVTVSAYHVTRNMNDTILSANLQPNVLQSEQKRSILSVLLLEDRKSGISDKNKTMESSWKAELIEDKQTENSHAQNNIGISVPFIKEKVDEQINNQRIDDVDVNSNSDTNQTLSSNDDESNSAGDKSNENGIDLECADLVITSVEKSSSCNDKKESEKEVQPIPSKSRRGMSLK